MSRPVIHPRMAAALARVVEGTLPDRGTILRPSTQGDGAGGMTGAPTTVAEDVPCRLEPDKLLQQEREGAGTILASLPWRITFAAGQDVRSQDQIVIGTRTFEVRGPSNPQSYDVETAVSCVEVL